MKATCVTFCSIWLFATTSLQTTAFLNRLSNPNFAQRNFLHGTNNINDNDGVVMMQSVNTLAEGGASSQNFYTTNNFAFETFKDPLFNFSYYSDEVNIYGPPGNSSISDVERTIGVVLIHPIGVGIGRWFYKRLINAMAVSEYAPEQSHLMVVCPDLLGSGSASNPAIPSAPELEKRPLPLLNISDWTDQLVDLMAKTEQCSLNRIDEWCVVANGGCSPIALQVAQRSVEGKAPFQQPVSQVVLSSLPRLPFFLEPRSNPEKVRKSYQTLCGLIGKLFWWYATRRKGKFIQKFREKNLVADPQNLGEKWRPNCFRTATMNGGRSRYSSFAFLAGSLQDGCVESLAALKKSNVSINLIKGQDNRRNKARSWFWQKKKKSSKALNSEEQDYQTFRDYLMENKFHGANEIVVNGRVSLAHEDPEGYSSAVLKFIAENFAFTSRRPSKS